MRRPPTVPVMLAGFTAFLDLYATQPLLPLFARIFNASNFSVSLTVTAPTIAVAIAAPFVGRLGDVFGRRRVIVGAAFLLTVATALAATATDLNQVIVWRFVQGLVTPGVFAVAMAYIHDQWTTSQVGRATGAYVTGTVIGGFSGRAVTGFVAAALGWRSSFIVLATLNLACAIALWRWLPHERRASHESSSRAGSLASHLTNRELLVTYAVGFCVLFVQVAIFTYVTFLLAAPPFHLSSAALGSLFTVYLVGAVITPFAGRSIDVYGHRTALTMAMAMGAAGALLTLSQTLAVVVAGLALCCSGVFISQATATTHVGAAAEHNRGLAVGLYATFYYIGGSVGGALPALFWNVAGWRGCVALVVIVQIVTAAIAIFFWDKRVGAREREGKSKGVHYDEGTYDGTGAGL